LVAADSFYGKEPGNDTIFIDVSTPKDYPFSTKAGAG